MKQTLKSPWPFGLGWLWRMFLVFGLVDPPEVPDPTPLEIATAMFIQTQRELLAAQSAQEEAKATVGMLTEREARLKSEMQRLSGSA